MRFTVKICDRYEHVLAAYTSRKPPALPRYTRLSLCRGHPPALPVRSTEGERERERRLVIGASGASSARRAWLGLPLLLGRSLPPAKDVWSAICTAFVGALLRKINNGRRKRGGILALVSVVRLSSTWKSVSQLVVGVAWVIPTSGHLVLLMP